MIFLLSPPFTLSTFFLVCQNIFPSECICKSRNNVSLDFDKQPNISLEGTVVVAHLKNHKTFSDVKACFNLLPFEYKHDLSRINFMIFGISFSSL